MKQINDPVIATSDKVAGTVIAYAMQGYVLKRLGMQGHIATFKTVCRSETYLELPIWVLFVSDRFCRTLVQLSIITFVSQDLRVQFKGRRDTLNSYTNCISARLDLNFMLVDFRLSYPTNRN